MTAGSRTSWTATELLSVDFPPPRWAVPGILAEGANLLAGPPKVGKSWFALNLAVAVAAGGKALSRVDVDAGDVLYLALEDTGRRLQSRLLKVLAGSPASERLTFTVECELLGSGGMERISGWLDGHPDARLVIVDVLARVRDRVSGASTSAYAGDYLAVAKLKRIADQHGIAILIVHHTRKPSRRDDVDAADFVAEVSGTHGLAGAADAILVLTRSDTKADATLRVTGRDVEESEHALAFDVDRGCWRMLGGPMADYRLGDTRLAIVRHLRGQDHPGTATPKQLADDLGIDHELVKKTCRRMADADQLDTDGQGMYFLPRTPLSPPSPVSLDSLGDGDQRDTRDTDTETRGLTS